jgi:hypothetical protein
MIAIGDIRPVRAEMRVFRQPCKAAVDCAQILVTLRLAPGLETVAPDVF